MIPVSTSAFILYVQLVMGEFQKFIYIGTLVDFQILAAWNL